METAAWPLWRHPTLSIVQGPDVHWKEEECCLHEGIEAQAKSHPDRIAVVDEYRSLTYSQLVEEAVLLARVLQGRGVVVGSVVGLLCPQNADWVVASLAIWIAGGALQPVYNNYSGEIINKLAKAANVKLFITSKAFLKAGALPPEYSASAVIVGDGGSWVTRLHCAPNLPGNASEQGDKVEQERIDEDHTLATGGRQDGEKGLRGAKQQRMKKATTLAPLTRVKLDPRTTLAQCAMTSGTTGLPKTIMCTHFACMANFLAREEMTPYGRAGKGAVGGGSLSPLDGDQSWTGKKEVEKKDTDQDEYSGAVGREACSVMFSWETNFSLTTIFYLYQVNMQPRF